MPSKTPPSDSGTSLASAPDVEWSTSPDASPGGPGGPGSPGLPSCPCRSRPFSHLHLHRVIKISIIARRCGVAICHRMPCFKGAFLANCERLLPFPQACHRHHRHRSRPERPAHAERASTRRFSWPTPYSTHETGMVNLPAAHSPLAPPALLFLLVRQARRAPLVLPARRAPPVLPARRPAPRWSWMTGCP